MAIYKTPMGKCNQDFYDFFCTSDGNDILSKIMKQQCNNCLSYLMRTKMQADEWNNFCKNFLIVSLTIIIIFLLLGCVMIMQDENVKPKKRT